MKRTFEGKVWTHVVDDLVRVGGEYVGPWLYEHCNKLFDRNIRLTIEIEEIEPTSLRDRVAKIFDDELAVSECSRYVGVGMMKDRVLAELDKEEQAR